MFLKEFGFRGAEFGNWVPQDERQQILNRAYDSLMDMANVLQVPPKALSLNGELGIGFGSRGQGLGKAKAHYESDRVVINLTRIKGAGSLAHEWFHAFDNYLGRRSGKSDPVRSKSARTGEMIELKKSKARFQQDKFVSHGFPYKSKVRQELRDKFDALMLTITRRQKEFDLNVDLLERRVDMAGGELVSQMETLTGQLRAQLDQKYYKRNNKPMTAAQDKQLGALFRDIAAGNYGEETYVQGKGWRGRNSFEKMEAVSVIYKKVRGRAGFAEHDVLTRMLGAISSLERAKASVAAAKKKNTETRSVSTDYYSEAAKLDRAKVKNYYSTPHELGARAFESWIYDSLIEAEQRDDYLVHSVTNDLYMPGMNPYPAGEERAAIDKAFVSMFDTVKASAPDEEGKVALYSRAPGRTPLAEVQLTETAIIEETGELVEIESSAAVRLRQMDKRIANVEKLRECLRS